MKSRDEFRGSAEEVRRESARRTRRSFLVGGLTASAAAAAAYLVDHSKPVGRLQSALRHTVDFNAEVNRTVFAERGLAPTYPVERAVPLRLNGVVGLDQQLDLPSWRLQLVGTKAGSSPYFSKDVTAWEYRYTGDMPDSSAAEDVKSAPGNGTRSKTGADAKEPDPQKPALSTAGSLDPEGKTDSEAAVSVTEKFQVLADSMKRKRNQGSAEAGPSYSSLDIGTPGLLLPLDFLTQKFPLVDLVTEFKCVEG